MLNTQFRTHFPFFEKSDGWTYLDSAATTLKPDVLIEATSEFYASAGRCIAVSTICHKPNNMN